MSKRILVVTALVAGLLASPALFAAGQGAAHRSCNSPNYSAVLVPDPALSAQEIADMTFMREEEKVARDVYLNMVEAYPALTVFANIAASEQRHMDAMLRMLNKYSVEDPVAGKGIGEFTVLQTMYDTLIAAAKVSPEAALGVGALIEETDIEDLMHAIFDTTTPHIAAVYENLMCGSRNHLRSFVQNLDVLGVTYENTVLSDEEFAAILAAPMETCN